MPHGYTAKSRCQRRTEMNGDSGPFKRLFPQKHIPTILISILKAGKSLHKNTMHDREDWITRRLCFQLGRIPIFRDGPLGVHCKQEILSSDPEDDSAAGEIDILVSCALGSEVYFAIEAKRLRFLSPGGQLRTGNDEYVKNGMMRFIDGRYSPFMKAGAMLGYVFDGDTGTARLGVDGYIRTKVHELKLKHPKGLVKSEMLPNESVDETRHDLTSRIFTIYHIFIDVR